MPQAARSLHSGAAADAALDSGRRRRRLRRSAAWKLPPAGRRRPESAARAFVRLQKSVARQVLQNLGEKMSGDVDFRGDVLRPSRIRRAQAAAKCTRARIAYSAERE